MEPAITVEVCSLERCQRECKAAFATLLFARRHERDLLEDVKPPPAGQPSAARAPDPLEVHRILELRDYSIARLQEWSL